MRKVKQIGNDEGIPDTAMGGRRSVLELRVHEEGGWESAEADQGTCCVATKMFCPQGPKASTVRPVALSCTSS